VRPSHAVFCSVRKRRPAHGHKPVPRVAQVPAHGHLIVGRIPRPASPLAPSSAQSVSRLDPRSESALLRQPFAKPSPSPRRSCSVARATPTPSALRAHQPLAALGPCGRAPPHASPALKPPATRSGRIGPAAALLGLGQHPGSGVQQHKKFGVDSPPTANYEDNARSPKAGGMVPGVGWGSEGVTGLLRPPRPRRSWW
jgi:hypothetical protein